MKGLFVGSTKVKFGKSCFSTFNSIYGVGKIRAKKLTAFYKYSPNKRKFGHRLKRPKEKIKYKEDFRFLVNRNLGRNIFNNSFFDIKVRLYVAKRMMEKITIFCYKAFRMFQNLPTGDKEQERMREHPPTLIHF